MVRKAFCCCGACSIEVEGEPTLNAVCHCGNCRRRTGSAFGWQVYFRDEQVRRREGQYAERLIRDEQVRSFCAACGTTLFWTSHFRPGETGIAAGAFTDATPPLPAPDIEARARERLDWVGFPDGWRVLS